MATIYIVEDDVNIREIERYALKNSGYEVEEFESGESMFKRLERAVPSLLLLDIMLPDGNGLDLLKAFREEGKALTVIILSARNSLEDKIIGLEEGADDYLPKPFHTAELLARIKSVTRRSNGSGRNGIVYGNVKLNPDSRTVEVGGKTLTLVKKEYDILHYFLLRPGHMVDKSVLAEAVWGDDIYLTDNFDFIYSQVKNLRKKLEEAGADIEIKSVYGFGYKLVTKE